MVLDASGILFWPAQNTLIVSDLHLGKASFLAQFGAILPPYDASDTLKRLENAIICYDPQHLVCLGDSFHDRKALERFAPQDLKKLFALVEGRASWGWILGNHDANLHGLLPGVAHPRLDKDSIRLTHEFDPAAEYQIIGHYHPKMRLQLAGNRVSGKCFLVSQKLLVMPAFGSFTGGLDCEDIAITSLSKYPFERYLLYRERLFKA